MVVLSILYLSSRKAEAKADKEDERLFS
jgi:hypothetical protein